jgi:hypothetical protein
VIGISEGIVLADRYLLVRRQIERGIGATWIAADTETGSDVWVQFTDDGGLAEVAALVQGIEHPAVPRVLDTGELRLIVDSRAVARKTGEDAPHATHVEIVIEFVVLAPLTGRALPAKIVRKALAPAEALTIAALLAGALELARGGGRSHGWLTADSVWLVRRGGYVADLALGLAFPDGTRIDVEQLVTGYFAAERIAGGAATEAADVYSLGWLLYEMLIGHAGLQAEYIRLVEGAGAVTTVELLALWRERARLHIAEILEADSALALLLAACLAEDARQRPALSAFVGAARGAANGLAGVGPLVEFTSRSQASKAEAAAALIAGAVVGAGLVELAEVAESGTAAGAGSEAGAAGASGAESEYGSKAAASAESGTASAASEAVSDEEAATLVVGAALGLGAAGLAAAEFGGADIGAAASVSGTSVSGASVSGAGGLGAVAGSTAETAAEHSSSGIESASASRAESAGGSAGGSGVGGDTGSADSAGHHRGRRRKALIATATAASAATFIVGLAAGYEWGNHGSTTTVAGPAGRASGLATGTAAAAGTTAPAAANASAACVTPGVVAAAASSTPAAPTSTAAASPAASAAPSAPIAVILAAPTSNASAFTQLNQVVQSAESTGGISASTGSALSNAIAKTQSATPGGNQWSSALGRLRALIQSGRNQGAIPESVANQLATALAYLYAGVGS